MAVRQRGRSRKSTTAEARPGAPAPAVGRPPVPGGPIVVGPGPVVGPVDTSRLPPGAVGAPVDIDAAAATALARAAVRLASGLPPAQPDGTVDDAGVVWVDGDRELYIGLGGVAISFAPGAVAVEVPVSCDQTGPTAVFVSFAVGSPVRPLGMVAATELAPRGPAAVIDVWGDPLVALSWQCLLDVASAAVARDGLDAAGLPLIPSSIHTDGKTLTVLPQSRFSFDARAR